MAELTLIERKALRVLADCEGPLHPNRVAVLAGDTYRSGARAGAGFRNALLALERRGLVKSGYQPHQQALSFSITDAGRELLKG